MLRHSSASHGSSQSGSGRGKSFEADQAEEYQEHRDPFAVVPNLREPSKESSSIASLPPEDVVPEWSTLQRRLALIVGNAWFDVLMGAAVAINMVLVIVETDDGARCLDTAGSKHCDPRTGIVVINWLLLIFYISELGVQLFVWRRRFFGNIWRTLDMIVVLLSIVAEIIGSVARNLKALRLLRLLRITRVVRLLGNFRELYMMLHGMLVTFKAVLWSALLMVGIMTVWSIVAVDVLYPEVLKVGQDGGWEECGEWCTHGLSSVYAADLTLFEMTVLGENWGNLVLPFAYSENSWVVALPIFFGVFFTVVVGLMNLVLAVIVDFAVDAREEDQKMQAMLKEKMRKDAKKQLMKLCLELDTDNGGTLTLEEFMLAFDNSQPFRDIMDVMDIDKEDVDCVFKIMDADHSGDVSYKEFADLLYKMKAQNSRTILLFIKHYTMEIRRTVSEELDIVRNQVTSQLYKNTSTLEQLASRLNTWQPQPPIPVEASAGTDTGSFKVVEVVAPGPCGLPNMAPGVEDLDTADTQQAWAPTAAAPVAACRSWAEKTKIVAATPMSSGGVPDNLGLDMMKAQNLGSPHSSRQAPPLAMPELDRLERLGWQIEKDLQALKSQMVRRFDERCDGIMSLSRRAEERQERFGELLRGVEADQKRLLATALDAEDPGKSAQARPGTHLKGTGTRRWMALVESLPSAVHTTDAQGRG